MKELGLSCRDENRIFAALCHLSGLIPLYGIIFSGLVWLYSRRRLPLLSAQALQAIAAQVIFLVALLIPLLGLLIVYLLHWLHAPMTETLLAVNIFFVRLMFVVSWVVFTYAAFRIVQSGVFAYPGIGDVLRIRENIDVSETDQSCPSNC